jgi:hypothetical protein
MGTPIVIQESAQELTINDTLIGDGTKIITYIFTDIYGAEHWTQALKR